MQGRNQIHTDAHSRIVVTLIGKQTAATIHALSAEVEQMTRDRHLRGQKAVVIYDARRLKLSDATAGSRVEGKKVLSLPVDASALITNRYLTPIASYLIRLSGHPERSRAFRNEVDALRWLDKSQQLPTKRPAMMQWAVGSALVLLGISVLVGWQTHNAHLQRWITTLRPMNPLSAVGLVILGLGLLALVSRHARRFAPWLAGGSVLLGLLALSPLRVDTLLYGAQVRAVGTHGGVADVAAACFVAAGLSLWLLTRKERWAQTLSATLTGAIALVGLGNFYGLLYAQQFVYQISSDFVMALNLAAAFIVFGLAVLFLAIIKDIRRLLGLITRTGWLIIVLFILAQVSTYQTWSVAVAHNKQYAAQAFSGRAGDVGDAVRLRLQAYVDALHGFRGLFGASDYVQQGEFQAYYDSLDLATTYPGIRAVTFIARVNDSNLPAFVTLHRGDTSLYPKGNPSFAISGKAAATTHYIIAYNATSSTGVGLGTDLAAEPSRKQVFQAAELSGDSIASAPVTFTTNGHPQLGFFITMPVYGKAPAKTQTPVGFVNAVFAYNDLLSTIFDTSDLLKGLQVAVIQDGQQIYASPHAANNPAQQAQETVPIADRAWQLKVGAASNFGLSESQERLPRTLLVFGQLVALFVAVIFIMQLRGRRQALALAESITEDLQYERNLAVANDHKSSAILASIGDAVFVVDAKQRITLFNPAAEKVSGYTKEEALGKVYDEILKFEVEKDGKPNTRFIRQALAGHVTSMANHTVLVRKDGKRVPVADSAAPIHDVHGKVVGAIVVFRDVTVEYQLDKAKTEFVSLASHQLRTPLSAINWYTELLLGGDAGRMTKGQQEYLAEIREGNRRMVDLVDALLNVSRLELGKLKNEPQATSLAELARSVEKELQPNITAGEVTYTAHLSSKLPTVFADPKQLRMIVQNLLSNAIKYTPKHGHVTLTLREATAGEIQSAHLRPGAYSYLQISDTGYGIPDSQQPKIFQKLFRADNVQALDVEGTGLGLYIVKEVVTNMGGVVWFESKEHQGTSFYVLLPFANHQGKNMQGSA